MGWSKPNMNNTNSPLNNVRHSLHCKELRLSTKPNEEQKDTGAEPPELTPRIPPLYSHLIDLYIWRTKNSAARKPTVPSMRKKP